ncbi:hypothetical protein C8R46DRAFT_1345013 [Mycena filopes]|nr:hypothetical protein C8R46DRAFT_1345013 [Mycena filopes]
MQSQPSASASDDGEREHNSGPAPSTPSRKKLRELKLRADKLVDVQGPTLVRCLLCGAMIKLSTKSEFDASHWLRHRARCVKRSKAAREGAAVGAGAGARAQVGLLPPPRSSGASSSDSAASVSPTLSARALTPQEEDDDADSEEGGVDSDPSQQTHADDFLVWQSWDWSQLKSRFFPPI